MMPPPPPPPSPPPSLSVCLITRESWRRERGEGITAQAKTAQEIWIEKICKLASKPIIADFEKIRHLV